MRSAEESLSEGELPRSPTAGQPRSQSVGLWASQGGDKRRTEQQREQRQTDKWPHDKWNRDEAPQRGTTAPAGEVQPASPSGKRRLRGRGRRRSGRGLEMDRVRPTAGSVQPSGGSEQRPLPPPAAEQPAEALGQQWQSPEERLAAEVAAEWRIKAQSPLWHRVMEGDVPRGSGNEALLLAAVAALEQAAAGGVHTALRFEERLSQLDRWVHSWAVRHSAAADPSAMHAAALPRCRCCRHCRRCCCPVHLASDVHTICPCTQHYTAALTSLYADVAGGSGGWAATARHSCCGSSTGGRWCGRKCWQGQLAADQR